MKKSGQDDITIEAEDVKPSMGIRAGMAMGGLIAGRLASRAVRPMAQRLATRYGMPAGTVVKIVDVTTPLLFTLVVETYNRRKSHQTQGSPPG